MKKGALTPEFADFFCQYASRRTLSTVVPRSRAGCTTIVGSESDALPVATVPAGESIASGKTMRRFVSSGASQAATLCSNSRISARLNRTTLAGGGGALAAGRSGVRACGGGGGGGGSLTAAATGRAARGRSGDGAVAVHPATSMAAPIRETGTNRHAHHAPPCRGALSGYPADRPGREMWLSRVTLQPSA